MGLVYNLKSFEKTIGHPISIKRLLIFNSGNRVEEYIQGRLKSVDTENDTIYIEQYLSFLDYLNGEKGIPSKVVELKNTEFEVISVLQG